MDARERLEAGKPLHVYIAGPYDQGDTMENIRAAVRAASRILDAGHYPYCPHLSGFWHFAEPRARRDWLDLDLAWLRRCDVLVRLPGESPGADAEVAAAQAAGIPAHLVADLDVDLPRLLTTGKELAPATVKPKPVYWSVGDSEHLEHESIGDAMLEYINASEGDLALLDATVELYGWARMRAELSAQQIAERALEELDEEMVDPEGEPSELTPAMLEAARTFCRAMEAAYTPWACEEICRDKVSVRAWAKEQLPEDEYRELYGEVTP